MRNVADIGMAELSIDCFLLDFSCWLVSSNFELTLHCCLLIGLHVLYSLLKSLEQETAVQSFYQTYYMMIVQHVLSVVTDTSHTAGDHRLDSTVGL